MADQTGRTDPFSDIISLVAGPIAAVIRSFDQLRKGSDELMKGLANFNRTMTTLNDTAERVNGLLNDIEQPVRAIVPQVTRTVKFADDFSSRLSGPLEQVIPGLVKLSDTLNSPVISALPNELTGFVDAINDLVRRLSPLGQIAESAGGLFGLRLPGMSRSTSTPAAPPPPVVVPPAPVAEHPAAKKSAARKTAAKKSAARKTVAKKSAARKTAVKQAAPAKKVAAQKSAAQKSGAARTDG